MSVKPYKADGAIYALAVSDDEMPGASLTEAQIKQEADKLLSAASSGGFNSLIIKAEGSADEGWGIKRKLSSGKNFDFLDYIAKQAAQGKIQLFVAIDPFYISAGNSAKNSQILVNGCVYWDPLKNSSINKALAAAGNIVKEYPLTGIFFTGLEFSGVSAPGSYTEAIKGFISSAASQLADCSLGIITQQDISGCALSKDMLLSLTSQGLADMVMPVISAASSRDAYEAVLERWNSYGFAPEQLCFEHSIYSEDFTELQYRLFTASVKSNSAGAAINGAELVASAPESQLELLYSTVVPASEGKMGDITLDYPKTLQIGYPATEKFTTSSSTVYISGNSDPSKPLTLNGNTVKQLGENGSFGVAVSVPIGTNVFTFKQGTVTKTVTIIRNAATSTVTTISNITAGSVFPQTDYGVDSNEQIVLSCVGPSGGKITATLNGKTVTLSQAAATAVAGVPATFKGTITLSPGDYPPDVTKSIGPVTYTLSYNGTTKTVKSPGEIVVAGRRIELAVRVTDYHGTVISDPDDDGTIIATLKKGMELYVTGKELTTRSGATTFAYKLASGGYILASRTALVTGSYDINAAVSSVDIKKEGREENVTFKTSKNPGVTSKLYDDRIELIFYYTTMTDNAVAELSSSEYITRAVKTDLSYGFKLTVYLDSSKKLWGYNVENTDAGVLLYLKGEPEKNTDYGYPLKGITVMLDPGHGGSDPGALGTSGNNGAAESEMNLAAAVAVKYRLEQLGAEVLMTRYDDNKKIVLDERCLLAEKAKPDIFLSLHHNSVAMTKDLSSVNWMESYYHFADSKDFAQNLADSLSAALGRTGRKATADYYYVTRLTFAKAVLFELGYIVNPAQYEDCCDEQQLYMTACAVAQAIVKTVRG